MKAPMTLLLSLLLATSAVATPSQSAPTGSPPAPSPPAAQQSPADAGTASERPGELPVSLDHIRDALSRPPAIRLEFSRAVFRV